ncbi:MAG: type III-B CRISPR module RAMP protein Cmr6 [bacterium JZ-2024 1]
MARRPPPHKSDGRRSRGTGDSRGSRPSDYPLPRVTADAVKSVESPKSIHRGLLLERFLSWTHGKADERTSKSGQWELQKTAEGFKGIQEYCGEYSEVIQEYLKRQEALLADLERGSYTVKKFRMTSESRVIVGLGAESILETHLRLHRIHGFPIIPGTALKGLARYVAFWELVDRYAIPVSDAGRQAGRADCDAKKKTPLELFEEYLEEGDPEGRHRLLGKLKELLPENAWLCAIGPEESPQKDPDDVRAFREVCGVVGASGRVVFLDAVPANGCVKLDVDVMNPHYAPYYQTREPPGDYHDPIPIFFLAIPGGTEFLFAVISRDKNLADKAKDWLVKGLTEFGIGAKTTSGYGLWRSVSIAEETPPGLSRSGTQVFQEPAPQVPLVTSPPISEKPPRKGDIVYACVTDNCASPIKVSLFVRGYEGIQVACSGVRNRESLKPGTIIGVRVSETKGSQVTMVSLERIWRSGS